MLRMNSILEPNLSPIAGSTNATNELQQAQQGFSIQKLNVSRPDRARCKYVMICILILIILLLAV